MSDQQEQITNQQSDQSQSTEHKVENTPLTRFEKVQEATAKALNSQPKEQKKTDTETVDQKQLPQSKSEQLDESEEREEAEQIEADSSQEQKSSADVKERSEEKEKTERTAQAKKPKTTPPASWSKDETAEWDSVPESARKAIYRRESDVNRVLKQTEDARSISTNFQNVMAPFLGKITKHNINPYQLITDALTFVDNLENANAQNRSVMIANLAKSYGVGAVELADALEGRIQIDQASASQQQRIRELEARVNQSTRQAHEQEQTQVAQAYDEFTAKTPLYVDREDVKRDMVTLLENERAKSFDEAYSLACRMNNLKPMYGTQSQTINTQNAQSSADTTAAIKAAQKGVNGAPRGASPERKIDFSRMTREEKIRYAMERARG